MSRRAKITVKVKKPGTLMGMAEVEEALGVPRSTINRWLNSGRMPAPLDAPRASPIWERKDIARFKERRDREHDEPKVAA